MHNLEVILACVSPPMTKGGTTMVLVLEEAGGLLVPVEELPEQESSIQVAARLLLRHLGLSARILGVGWVELKQHPLVDNADRMHAEARHIGVPYSCIVPGHYVKPLDPRARWLSITEAVERREAFLGDHHDILLSICQRI